MEARIPYQDVPVADHQYRLRKLDARTGTWLFSLLTAKAAPEGDPCSMQQLVTAFHLLDKKDYDLVQNEVLKRIYLLEVVEDKEFESMILVPNGSGIAHEFLRDDVASVSELTDLQVVFNLTPFFERSSNSKPQAKSASSPQSTPASTPS